MNQQIPQKFIPGNRIQITGLSRSLGGIVSWQNLNEADIEFAQKRIESLGLQVIYPKNSRDYNEFLSTSVENRIEELNDAFLDSSIKGILAVSGGIGAIQLLDHIDFDLISKHPKILCGYSDIGYISNAIWAKTGLVTYYGPTFSRFFMQQGFEYSIDYFKKCLFHTDPFDINPSESWSDDNWIKDQKNRTFYPNEGYWAICEGYAEGTIIGGSIYALNRLQGSKYFPNLYEAIVFCELPGERKATLLSIDTALRTLSYQPGFDHVRGIVIGRFPQNCRVNPISLKKIIQGIPGIKKIPVIANVDFGHTSPMATIPIGGKCTLESFKDKIRIRIVSH